VHRRMDDNPPLDGTPVILAARLPDNSWRVGEARCLNGDADGWWWAEDAPGAHGSASLSERGHIPEWWWPMPKPPTDLQGRRFGALTVLHRVPTPGKNPTWLCRCECGQTTTVTTGALVATKRTKSCGCRLHPGREKTARATTSKFKGVSFHSRSRKWKATIMHEGKSKHLGWFDDEERAARAYDAEAVKTHGDKAMTNQRMGLFPV
jgi:hypothetical protein